MVLEYLLLVALGFVFGAWFGVAVTRENYRRRRIASRLGRPVRGRWY